MDNVELDSHEAMLLVNFIGGNWTQFVNEIGDLELANEIYAKLGGEPDEA